QDSSFGSSNCWAFMREAARMSSCRGPSSSLEGSGAGGFLGAVTLHRWQIHSPAGRSSSSSGGSLRARGAAAPNGGPTHWHWRWKVAGQRSQQIRSPPSLQLSQASWFTVRPLGRCRCRVFFLHGCSLAGGAISDWI
ncbi:unnamed protein product, partial [Ixodes pacificus]